MDQQLIGRFKALQKEFVDMGGNLDAVIEKACAMKGEAPLETYCTEEGLREMIKYFKIRLGRK